MSENKSIVINGWLIDCESSSITNNKTEETKKLGEYQFLLLVTLATNAGKIISKEDLIKKVWKGRYVGNSSLLHAIHAIRIAVGDDGKNQSIIKTINRKGYILDQAYLRLTEQKNTDSSLIAVADSDVYDVEDTGERAQAQQTDSYTTLPAVINSVDKNPGIFVLRPTFGMINIVFCIVNIITLVVIIKMNSNDLVRNGYPLPVATQCYDGKNQG